MKKNRLLITVLFIFFVLADFAIATPTFFREHKTRTKNGVKVVKSCSFCHNSNTKLKKRSGQDYKKVQKTPTCSGKGCH